MSRSAAAARRARKSADLSLPKHPPHRLSAAAPASYDAELAARCKAILEINSTLDFRVSSRGWCYILEQNGALTKGDFDKAQRLINDCRKSGALPIDICSEDEGRAVEGLEDIDEDDVDAGAAGVLDYVRRAHNYYAPFSSWENQPRYVEMATEKVDLKSLFARPCEDFHVPIVNFSGWVDINARFAMMQRFARWEAKGKQCVLLYCGDHDPGGLHISEFTRSNFNDLAAAVGWSPENLIIERFGLDYAFIEELGLTWIDNLETGSGKSLDDTTHRDHAKPYVRYYLEQFGARKCEVNALVTRPVEGRALCRRAILRHVDRMAFRAYERRLGEAHEEFRLEVRRQIDASGFEP